MLDFEALLQRYNRDTCTPEERALVEAWYAEMEVGAATSLTDAQLARLFLEGNTTPTVSRRIGWRAASIAASLLLGLAILYNWPRKPVVVTGHAAVTQIQPGGNKATLTLANGQTIALDAQSKGTLAKQAGASISIATGGQLRYNVTQDQATPVENVLRTPRGGMYSIQLPDGSVAWLNAASALRYPANFRGMPVREVTLQGEAYFEIAADNRHPFRINTAKQTITVLGTHFNVNAYEDEPQSKTTLLEGRILVQEPAKPGHQLLPGQQAIVDEAGITVNKADVNAAVGWKADDFIFNDDIHVIMRQLSRWYNVAVVYQGNIPSEHFIASISRKKSIQQVLMALSLTQRVHFKIDGNTITVTP